MSERESQLFDPLAAAKNIEAQLWKANIAYVPENDPRLWRISPRYFVIRQLAYEQLMRQAALLPKLISGINILTEPEVWNPTEGYYFRFDATLDTKGNIVPMEFQNEVPVEDATVHHNRAIFEDTIPMPRECFNPFVGSIDGITAVINHRGGNLGVAIVIPQSRSLYFRDYREGARLLSQRGINAWVSEGNFEINKDGLKEDGRQIDIVYRAFTRKDISEGGNVTGGSVIHEAYESGLVDMFPQFSAALEDKGAMAMLYMPEYQEQMLDILGEEDLGSMRGQYPFTWVCNAENNTIVNGQRVGWGSCIMGEEAWKDGYVLKLRRSFGSSGMFISREISLPKWREAVLQSLTTDDGNYIIQKYVEPQRFWTEILDENQLVKTDRDYGVRLSATCVVVNGQSQIVELDACLSTGFRIHGTRDSVLVPVVVRRSQNGTGNNF